MEKELTKQEAIDAMNQGAKVRHERFSDDEWMTIDSESGKFLLEDGVKCSQREFWLDRTNPEWQNGWSIVSPSPTKNQDIEQTATAEEVLNIHKSKLDNWISHNDLPFFKMTAVIDAMQEYSSLRTKQLQEENLELKEYKRLTTIGLGGYTTEELHDKIFELQEQLKAADDVIKFAPSDETDKEAYPFTSYWKALEKYRNLKR